MKSKSKQVFDDFCTMMSTAELMPVETVKEEKSVPETGSRTWEKSDPFFSAPWIVCANSLHI